MCKAWRQGGEVLPRRDRASRSALSQNGRKYTKILNLCILRDRPLYKFRSIKTLAINNSNNNNNNSNYNSNNNNENNSEKKKNAKSHQLNLHLFFIHKICFTHHNLYSGAQIYPGLNANEIHIFFL